jgi:hypothetical protein
VLVVLEALGGPPFSRLDPIAADPPIEKVTADNLSRVTRIE